MGPLMMAVVANEFVELESAVTWLEASARITGK
jgi:hypothetical protein